MAHRRHNLNRCRTRPAPAPSPSPGPSPNRLVFFLLSISYYLLIHASSFLLIHLKAMLTISIRMKQPRPVASASPALPRVERLALHLLELRLLQPPVLLHLFVFSFSFSISSSLNICSRRESTAAWTFAALGGWSKKASSSSILIRGVFTCLPCEM